MQTAMAPTLLMDTFAVLTLKLQASTQEKKQIWAVALLPKKLNPLGGENKDHKTTNRGTDGSTLNINTERSGRI